MSHLAFTSSIQGIICGGWFHERNLEGLKAVCEEYKLEFIQPISLLKLQDKSCNDLIETLSLYPGRYFVFIGDAVFNIELEDKYFIFGPHIFPHDINLKEINEVAFHKPSALGTCRFHPKRPVFFNTLCSWVTEKYKHVTYPLRLVELPFPMRFPLRFDKLTNFTKPPLVSNFGSLPMSHFTLTGSLISQSISTDSLTLNEKTSVLIYIKNREPTLNFWSCLSPDADHQVFRYGEYKRDKYLDEIRKAKYGIFLCGSESQGFAILEALALNLPLIICDIEYYKDNTPYPNILRLQFYNSFKDTLKATAVPWFTQRCGMRITNLDDLPKAIKLMETRWKDYSPKSDVEEEFNASRFYERCLHLFEDNEPVRAEPRGS